MQYKAVLDMINFPVNAPGALYCRLARSIFRDDGSVIDQGTRSTPNQRNTWRVDIQPEQDISARLAEVHIPDYQVVARPEIIAPIAALERDRAVMAERAKLTKSPAPRLRVFALGFDIVDAGELMIGLAKTSGVDTTQKAGVLILPGDPVEQLFDALDEFADRIGYAPLIEADRRLVLKTAALAAQYQRNVLERPDYDTRVLALEEWKSVPVGAPVATPEFVQ